jgi:hypothetical protein
LGKFSDVAPQSAFGGRTPIINKFSKARKQILTRREMLERLYYTRCWPEEIDEGMTRDIVLKIEMVRTEWDITSDVLPSICRYQLLPDHLKWIKQKESGGYFVDKDLFSEKVGAKTFSLSARQLTTYKSALNWLEKNNIKGFFNEFYDFMENYRENIDDPINVAEKRAISAMIHFFQLLLMEQPS